MVKIKIENEEHNIDDIDPSWINQQINRRRKDGPVCVRVTINTNTIDMTLSSGDCPRVGGRGHQARPQEKEIFALWDKHGLNGTDFPSGQLVTFIKQLKKSL
jgi:hypothetical protein